MPTSVHNQSKHIQSPEEGPAPLHGPHHPSSEAGDQPQNHHQHDQTHLQRVFRAQQYGMLPHLNPNHSY